jgi:hypothetical protein
MDWLSYTDAERLAGDLIGFRQSQVLQIYANIQSVPSDIPTQPAIIPPSKGPPSTMREWYGRVGDRVFAIEAEADVNMWNCVKIYTHFLQSQDILGDWTVLQDLQGLPTSFFASRPLYVESRVAKPNSVVYRLAPQGWSTPIYNAKSLEEAESLLAFMKADEWNATCFVGSPAPAGAWSVMQGEEAVSGPSHELHVVLQFGCEWSLRYPSVKVTVRDISGKNTDVFVVSQGMVVNH